MALKTRKSKENGLSVGSEVYRSSQLNLIWQEHKTVCLVCWGMCSELWMWFLFLHIFPPPSVPKQHSNPVHPKMLKKYDLCHVLTHARLPSTASPFPTNHVLGSSSVPPVNHVESEVTQTYRRKPHRKWSNRDYGCHVLPCMFLETAEERTRHPKCHSLHTINRLRLRFQPQKSYYVNKNKSAVPTSDS